MPDKKCDKIVINNWRGVWVLYLNKIFILSVLICLVLGLNACNSSQPSNTITNNINEPINNIQNDSQANKKISSEQAKNTISSMCGEVILAMKNSDFEKLSKYIHPEKGVRCSPYSYIRNSEDGDKIFTDLQVSKFDSDTTKYRWGNFDGSGMPINLTPKEYFKTFVYSYDFANTKEIYFNNLIKRGNTIDNCFEVYPNSIVVEYYSPGVDPKYDGMDWQSLRLVFEEYKGKWYLVGVIHGQWTI